MSRLEVAALVILVGGALGYLASLTILVRFRMWMGERGQGWPRLLLSTMLVREFLLAALYLTSIVSTLGLMPRSAELLVSFGAGILLAIAPWVVVVALGRWWPRSAGARRRGRGGDH